MGGLDGVVADEEADDAEEGEAASGCEHHPFLVGLTFECLKCEHHHSEGDNQHRGDGEPRGIEYATVFPHHHVKLPRGGDNQQAAEEVDQQVAEGVGGDKYHDPEGYGGESADGGDECHHRSARLVFAADKQ